MRTYAYLSRNPHEHVVAIAESDDGLECMGEKTRAERDAELRSEAVDLEDL